MFIRKESYDRWNTQLMFYWRFFGKYNIYAVLDGILKPIVKLKEIDTELAFVWLEKTTNDPLILKGSTPIYVSNQPMLTNLKLEDLNVSSVL